MVESKKGHNLVNISRNLLKSLSGHPNIDSKPNAKYQNPSSGGSQDILLTRFFYCYNGRVENGAKLCRNRFDTKKKYGFAYFLY